MDTGLRAAAFICLSTVSSPFFFSRFLVDTTGIMTEIKDRAMFNRLFEIEQLEQEDIKTIVHVIDSLLRDARARKTNAVH